MSVITLPADDLVQYRFTLFPPPQESVSALETNMQQIEAAGARWRVTISLRRLPDHRFEEWADLYEQGATFAWPIPQPGATVGDPGAPVADGSPQLGRTLSVRNLSNGYAVGKGRWLTVTSAGRARAFHTTAAVTAAAGGAADLRVNPPIFRRSVSDGDAVDLAAPHITGFIDFAGFARTQGFSRTDPFTLTER